MVQEENISHNNHLKELEAFSLEKTTFEENVSRKGCVGRQSNIWELGKSVLKSDLIVTPVTSFKQLCGF